MRRFVTLVVLAAVAAAVVVPPALAQRPRRGRATAPRAKPLTGDAIIERSLEAAGGRAALLRYKSSVLKGTLTVPNQNLFGTIQIYSKAPNKRLTVLAIGEVFNATQGFDGTTAWSSDNLQGTRVLEGVEAALQRRDAVFAGDARWRELWQRAELAGEQQLSGRAVYAVRLIPKAGEGNPLTIYYDKETFLPAGSETVIESVQGTFPVKIALGDYRRVGGLMVPHSIDQQISAMTMKVAISSVEFDVPVDDARFAMPR